MKRKELEFKARRDYILETAQILFEKNGIERTSMEEIAKISEYTRRTLYSYFKSRDEICLLVSIKDIKQRWEYQQKFIKRGKTGIEQLYFWGDSLYRYNKKKPASLKFQKYWDYNGINKDKINEDIFQEFTSLNDQLANVLREIFNKGIEDESIINNLNVDMHISQFLFSLRSIISRALSDGYSFSNFDPDEYTYNFLNLFINSIKNKQKECKND